LCHIDGVAGGITNACEIRQRGQRLDQLFEAATRIVAPGIDVLAQQRDLFRTGFDQSLRFIDQIIE
jgi:hypothetical protein